MPKFLVQFNHTQYSTGSKVIEAESQAEAEALAEEITADQLETTAVDGQLEVESVTPV